MVKKCTHHRSSLKKVYIFLGAIAALLIFGLGFLMLDPSNSPTIESMDFVKGIVAKQEKIEGEIQTYYRDGNYTFAKPLVIQDPYQTAPLTAWVIFDTPENSQIAIHVPGKDPESSVDFTFKGYVQHHEIPIYGLYADTLNHVTITKETESGESSQNTIDLQTEPLPAGTPVFQVDQVERNKYSPGFNFTALSSKQIFDIDGNVRWYTLNPSFQVYTPLKNGRFLFTYKYMVGKKTNAIIFEQDLLGKIYTIYNIPNGIDHDICELPNGNLLVTSSDLKTDTIEDYIYEIDRKSGHVVRAIDLKDYLDQKRTREINQPYNDWLHLNSIVYDPTDQSIIISSRAQSAVIKFAYPSMKIKWILGSHDNWSTQYQPYLLTPVGENFEWPWSQHDATLFLPDSLADSTVDIELFDNGQYRSFDPATAAPPSDWYSMIVHYQINEAAMTVQEIQEYGKENGTDTFSYIRGSAQVLPNGDVLGTWGDISKDAKGNPIAAEDPKGTVDSKITEIDPNNNDVVFNISMPNTGVYRSFRAGFYDGYSDQNSYLSTSLKDTSGYDVLDRAFMVSLDFHRWETRLISLMKSVERHARQLI